ncbi:restriction endonuclease subunit S [Aliarcobacter cryaerophilus]|uniref:restriction endonuclease subunit S n=1 Tax=Aliarcobacter cryaerophilus TaxID=28198 RepID=UPI003DA5BF97
MAELYSLPNGWEWKKLRDKVVCELIMGQSPSSDTYNSDGIGIPFFQGKTEFGEIYPRVSKYCTTPNKIAQIGDILLSVRAPVGPTNIANIECCIGRGLGAIRPNSKNTLTNYLLYFFRNFEIEISNKGKGSTFPAITKKELEEINIPLPPLEEQKRIVVNLDNLFAKIDKAIALHQKNIDEADIFMASVLNDVFVELEEKSEIKRLNECFIVKDGTHDSPKYIEDGYPLFTSKNLKDYGLDTSNFNSINKEDYDNINKRSKVDKGDLLFAMIGTIGNPTIVNFEPNFAIKNVALFKPLNEESIMTYLRYYFMSEKTITKMKNEANGATQKFVGLTYLREFPFPFIDVKTQQKVVSYLDEISQKMEKIKNLQKEKMQSLKELKASILDKAFKGEL